MNPCTGRGAFTTPAAGALAARFTHAASLGAFARLDFVLEGGGETIHVELPRDRLRALALRAGDVAYLRPERIRRFAEVSSA